MSRQETRGFVPIGPDTEDVVANPAGFYKAAVHVHTRCSDGFILTPERAVDLALNLGFRIIAITDHNTIEGSEQAQVYASKHDYGRDITVISGSEVSSGNRKKRGGHILALGIQNDIPAHLPPEETIRLIHKAGGVAVIAHPAAGFADSLSFSDIMYLLQNGDKQTKPDGYEVYNAGSKRMRFMCVDDPNQSALNFYNDNNLNQFFASLGGADAHMNIMLNAGYTLYPSDMDFLTAIRTRRTVAAREEYNIKDAISLARFVIFQGRQRKT